MMRKLSLIVLAVFLFGAVSAFAKDAAVEGTVQKMDKNSITVQVGSEQKTFTFERGMKITVDGKRPKELTVKPGDKASIVADKNNVAKQIDFTSEGSESGTGSQQ
jgi:hypothetical protein